MTAKTRDSGFFTEGLATRDPEISAAIRGELGRQRHEIELIASENIVSAAVMSYPATAGSVIVTTVPLVRTTSVTSSAACTVAFHPPASLCADTSPSMIACRSASNTAPAEIGRAHV